MLRDNEERNIKNIIIKTYEEEAKFQDEDFDDFYIFISTIMHYGYSPDEIEEFAMKYGIEIDPDDEDPDDEYDTMNEQKQIEELEVDLLLYVVFSKNGGVKCGDTAKALYNAGYRKTNQIRNKTAKQIDGNPDDEYDTGFGSLKVNKAKIKELKKL